jgi:hypothetical protein
LLALSKIQGHWGGFETLEKWVTRAQAGHTAVCLRDEHDNLSGWENQVIKMSLYKVLPASCSPLLSFLPSPVVSRSDAKFYGPVFWVKVLAKGDKCA